MFTITICLANTKSMLKISKLIKLQLNCSLLKYIYECYYLSSHFYQKISLVILNGFKHFCVVQYYKNTSIVKRTSIF